MLYQCFIVSLILILRAALCACALYHPIALVHHPSYFVQCCVLSTYRFIEFAGLSLNMRRVHEYSHEFYKNQIPYLHDSRQTFSHCPMNWQLDNGHVLSTVRSIPPWPIFLRACIFILMILGLSSDYLNFFTIASGRYQFALSGGHQSKFPVFPP